MLKIKQIRFFIITCYFLKPFQIVHQLINRLKPKTRVFNIIAEYSITGIEYKQSVISEIKLLEGKTFRFLNLEKTFNSNIDWNFSEYGKLWTYNLEYFDYLNQENLDVKEKISLIDDFYNFSIKHKRILEPYPVSLRTINIIKFVNREGLLDKAFLSYTYQELEFLNKNYEFHILGNHLLENCFAMLLGGAFFNETNWRVKAEKILRDQLNEQILDDGAHFELSPMYHQIILYRVLELIDWYSAFKEKDEKFLKFLECKASLMLGWLGNIAFKDGTIPLFNDAANGITYTSSELFDYANSLNITAKNSKLKESGYRVFSNDNYEIKIDFAQIGASYQPGHAHADALSFLMHYKGKPLFVEAGTSTYQIGEQRSYERSTKAHNTVEIGNKNQSQVWSGFRVAKRANTTITSDDENKLRAFHNGYTNQVGKVFREFVLLDDRVEINDSFEKEGVGVFYLHLDADISIVNVNKGRFLLSNDVSINFSSFISIEVSEFKYAKEFNKYNDSQTIVVTFKDELKTRINL